LQKYFKSPSLPITIGTSAKEKDNIYLYKQVNGQKDI
jgi:hypothetical protein